MAEVTVRLVRDGVAITVATDLADEMKKLGWREPDAQPKPTRNTSAKK